MWGRVEGRTYTTPATMGVPPNGGQSTRRPHMVKLARLGGVGYRHAYGWCGICRKIRGVGGCRKSGPPKGGASAGGYVLASHFRVVWGNQRIRVSFGGCGIFNENAGGVI